jgi:predicted transcriptional regulator
MSDSATLPLRLAAGLKERLGVLAAKTKRTRSFLAGEALADYVERELAIIDGIHRGLDDVEAGRVIPHDEAMRRIRGTIRRAAKRQP